jgi:hypothetical protein
MQELSIILTSDSSSETVKKEVKGITMDALRDTLYTVMHKTGAANGNLIVGYPQKVLEGEEPSF